jgi:hypothetical protein
MTARPDPTLIPIERPRCRRCQTRMMLARIEPYGEGSEKRTFECSKCSAVESTVVSDPISSEAIARLTQTVRPPT